MNKKEISDEADMSDECRSIGLVSIEPVDDGKITIKQAIEIVKKEFPKHPLFKKYFTQVFIAEVQDDPDYWIAVPWYAPGTEPKAYPYGDPTGVVDIPCAFVDKRSGMMSVFTASENGCPTSVLPMDICEPYADSEPFPSVRC